MSGIKKMSVRHDQILEWLLQNPDRKMRDCAMHFGISQPWLSQIVHSDAFQAKYRERCAELEVLALHTVNDKLNNVVALTLEKVEEHVAHGAPSEKFLTDVMATGLKAAGYGNTTILKAEHNHQHVHVSAEKLEEARRRAEERRRGTTPQKIEHEALPALAGAAE